MAKDPAFLFYPGDWLGGTMTFSRSHKGAYMDLLMAQFNQGRLSLQDIETVLGPDFESMWENKLKAKFTQDEKGLFYNERLEKEKLRRMNFTKSRRNNLSISINNTTNHNAHMINHMDLHMENRNINENEIYNEVKIIDKYSFEIFWNLYDKKVGDRARIEKKYNKLSLEIKEAIFDHVEKYKIAQPDKQFRKNPETYLNQKGWEHEIIKTNNYGKQTADERNAAIEASRPWNQHTD